MKQKALTLLIILLSLQNTSAQSAIDSIQRLIKRERNETKKIDLTIDLAIFFNRKNTDSAIYYANTALNKAIEKQYNLGIADSYNALAWANFRQSYYKKADSLILKAIDYYENLENVNEKKGNSYRLLAAISIEEKRFDEALKQLLKAKDIYDTPNLKNKDVKIFILNEIAYLYLEMDNYIMSMKYLNESIASAKTKDNSTILADCYFILGTINSRQKNYTKAIEYFNLSKDIYIEKNDLLSLVGSNSKIGINHYNNKSYNKAIEYLEIAKEQAKNISYNYGLMENLIYLGKSHTKLNNLNKAKSYLTEARKIAEKHQIATSEIILAESDLAIKNNNYNKAIQLLENRISKKDKNINPKAKIDLYESLSEAYKKNRDFEKSLNAKDQLLHIQDSINNTQRVIQLNVLQAEFEYKKVKNDLKNKEIELQMAEKQNETTDLINSLLIIGGILLISIFSLIYLRIKSSQEAKKEIWETKQKLQEVQQKQLDNEIKFKNKQITDFAIHIYEKNELLLDIKEKLKDLTKKMEGSKINDLILFLNNNLEQNKEKIALYSIADNTKDAFYHKLSDLYPNLSVKERRVAAFVRLGLTSKQIAIQLGITISSIDNYRYNLRKKMNVPKETTLNNFLKDL